MSEPKQSSIRLNKFDHRRLKLIKPFAAKAAMKNVQELGLSETVKFALIVAADALTRKDAE